MLSHWAPSPQEPELLQRVGALPLPPTLSSLSPQGSLHGRGQRSPRLPCTLAPHHMEVQTSPRPSR